MFARYAQISKSLYGRLALFGVALATGVLVALVLVPAASRSSQGIVVKSGANFEYPTSMQDYVDRSEIVISGTIVNRSFLGWTTNNYSGENNALVIEAPDAQSIRATPYIEITAETEEGNQLIRVRNTTRNWRPYSAYTIRVDHIFKTDGSIAVDHEITLHRIGTLDGANQHGAPTPPLSVDDEYLFALVKAPDSVNYSQGFSGASCLSLSGGPNATNSSDVYEMWNIPVIVGFTENTDADSFLAALNNALSP